MFGGSGDRLAQSQPRLLGVDPGRTATSDQGRPVPYVAGKFPIGGTYLDEPWDVRSEAIVQKVGKKKQVVGYNYFCDFAMIFSIGEWDYLDQILIESQVAWEGPLAASGDYADITVENVGACRIFWGTTTQDAGAYMTAQGCPNSHPGYIRQVVIVFTDWFLGANRTSIPNIELRARRQPDVTASLSAATGSGLSDDANLVGVLFELLTDEYFGAGIPAARFDLTTWNSAASATQNEGIGVSPVITTATTLPQMVATALDYVDGYRVADTSGKMALGLIREEASSASIGADDIVGEPDIDSHLWWDTVNKVAVKFRHRSKGFQDDAVTWRDRGNFAIVGRNNDLQVNRGWITRQIVAWYVAAGIAKREALPYIEGTIRVTRDLASVLSVGDVFSLTYGPQNLSAVLCRVVSWSVPSPNSPHITIRFVEERGYLNESLYEVAEDADISPEEFTPEVPHDQLAIELPYQFTGTRDVSVAILVARGDPMSNGFNWYEERAAADYQLIDSTDLFCRRGTLNADLAAETLIHLEGTIRVNLTGPDVTLPAVTWEEAIATNSMLLFIGGEILSVYDASLVSAGVYDIRVIRARFGTKREAHSASAEVWIAHRAATPVPISVLDSGTTAQNFKAQPFLFGSEVALADLTAFSLSPTRRAYRPTSPDNLTANGAGSNASYSTGNDVVVDWTPTSDEREPNTPGEVLVPRVDVTVIEIRNTSDTLMETIEVAGYAGPYTITNAALVTALGGEASFKLRVSTRYAGLDSPDYAALSVALV